MNSIFHRTSIRQFQDKVVCQKKINKILEAAMTSPSAGNQQPWEFYVIENKNILEYLSKSSPYAGCTKNAPMAIVVCYRKNVRFKEYTQIDSAACVENILLEADALGLGAVWLGIAPIQERMDNVKEIIGFNDDLDAFAIIPCGYPVKTNLQQNRFDLNKIHYIK